MFIVNKTDIYLASLGIVVLRFDFTGLGHSSGEFAKTSFSSNIEDLLLAANFLREEYQAPQWLIGHSLGGATILAAAENVPEEKAVISIGAPADPQHVIHNFSQQTESIKKEGQADVQLGGRIFTIKQQFLDDISKVSLKEKIGSLRKALLVFHAPLDETVELSNAAAIFKMAKHPKSLLH